MEGAALRYCGGREGFPIVCLSTPSQGEAHFFWTTNRFSGSVVLDWIEPCLNEKMFFFIPPSSNFYPPTHYCNSENTPDINNKN